MLNIQSCGIAFVFMFFSIWGGAQISVQGTIYAATTGDAVFACNVIIKGSTTGVTSDFDGEFDIVVKEFPVVLVFSFIGYITQELEVVAVARDITVRLEPDQVLLSEAEVVGERISEKQKQAPLTMESMDVIGIKEAPSGNFYEGLGNLKEVDMTSASLGFKILNTRGFNSTSPVRSLQLIDGVDNQSPGLNFSLGNFLGSSDLDVMKVDIIAGASSAFYGPGAFNGVISMYTKDPFLFPGFSTYLKKGERGLFEQSFRFAEVIKNSAGEDKFGYKLNFFKLVANDWEANNFSAIYGAAHDETNPYGFDAVNIYGDEPNAVNNDNTDAPLDYSGLGVWYRNGYKEQDLVNYKTDNLKFNTGLYYKLTPDIVANYNFAYSTGSTIYHGDNRYALRDIQFFQHKVEIGEPNKWFVRGYSTTEDAGNTYDIVTTAVRMLDASGTTSNWNTRFASSWGNTISDQVQDQPRWGEIFDQVLGSGLTGDEQLEYWYGLLNDWYLEDYDYFHGLYLQNQNATNDVNSTFLDPFYEPGTQRFDSLFSRISSQVFTDGGSRFYDKSKLYHLHGEYKTEWKNWDFTFGANARWYRPDSRGTIFKDTLQYVYTLDSAGHHVLNSDGSRAVSDSSRVKILNKEWGAYVGTERWFNEEKLKTSVTARLDKNENFEFLFSPAASLVYLYRPNHIFRSSFSSAIRNPTLADQYLHYNVGRALLLGNIDGRFEEGLDSLFTIESFRAYRNSPSLAQGLDELEYFNVSKIRPEKVKTFELGYRGTWFENTYVDISYYISRYRDFIGYNIGLNGRFNQSNGFPIGGVQVFRVAANAREIVTTTGISLGLNYYFKRFSLNGNYSFNKLISDNEDPIIPAFNTPENKFNLGLSARDLTIFGSIEHVGFGLNYKWIQGFIFEGSPQFTGPIDSYDMVDAQVNVFFPKAYCTLKFGGSNILGIKPLFDSEIGNFGERIEATLNNNNLQVYGGPRVGRLLYVSVLFEIK